MILQKLLLLSSAWYSYNHYTQMPLHADTRAKFEHRQQQSSQRNIHVDVTVGTSRSSHGVINVASQVKHVLECKGVIELQRYRSSPRAQFDAKSQKILQQKTVREWQQAFAEFERSPQAEPFSRGADRPMHRFAQQWNCYQYPAFLAALEKEIGAQDFESLMLDLAFKIETDPDCDVLQFVQGNPAKIILDRAEQIRKRKQITVDKKEIAAIRAAIIERRQLERELGPVVQNGVIMATIKPIVNVTQQQPPQPVTKIVSVIQEQFDAAIKRGDFVTAERLKNRLQADTASSESNFAILTQEYALSIATQKFLSKNPSVFNAQSLFKCTGTHLQQQLHKELLAEIDKTVLLLDAHNGVEQIKEMTFVSLKLEDLACVLNQQGHVEQAASWIDALQAGNGYIRDIAYGLTKGSAASLQRAAVGVGQMLICPDQAAMEFIYLSGKAILKTLQIVAYMDEMGLSDFSVSPTLDATHLEKTAQELLKVLPVNPAVMMQQFIDASVEEKAYIIGNLATEVVLFMYTPKILPKVTQGHMQALGLSQEMFAAFGSATQQTISTMVGVGIVQGEHYMQRAMDLVKKYPKLLKAEFSYNQNMQRAVRYVQRLEAYTQDLANAINFRLTKHPLAEAMTEAGLPVTFIPEAEALVLKTEQTAQGTKYIDKFGSRYYKQQGQWVIDFSAEHEKFLAFMLDQEKSAYTALELDQKIAEAIEIVVADKGFPHHMYKRVPQYLKFYFEHMKFEIENLTKTIMTSLGGIRETCGFSIEELRHVYEPLFKSDKNGILKKIHGFHHDFCGILERSGLVKLKNKVMGIGGVYKADVTINGVTSPNKTFFPTEWSRRKVLEKIVEASENLVKPIETQWDGTKVLHGRTLESIEIKIIITPEGKVSSAYPVKDMFI